MPQVTNSLAFPEAELLGRANLLCTQAEALQDIGEYERAAWLLGRAEFLCTEADRILNDDGVPSISG